MGKWEQHPSGFKQWFPEYRGESMPQRDPYAGCAICGAVPEGDPEGNKRIRLTHNVTLHEEHHATLKSMTLPTKTQYDETHAEDERGTLADMADRIAREAEHQERQGLM